MDMDPHFPEGRIQGEPKTRERDPEDKAPPRLVHLSPTSAVYHSKGTGIKVLLDPNPSEEQTDLLIHEQRISNLLPSSCRKRRVIGVKRFGGKHALHFEWSKGVTFKKWLLDASSPPQAGRTVLLKAAIAITKTLSDFHDAGVAHNKLSPENIVLDISAGAFVATLIDLSRAILFAGENHSGDEDIKFSQEAKQADLKSLGSIFNDTFGKGPCLDHKDEEKDSEGYQESQEPPVDNENQCKKKRGKQPSSEGGLPLYLGSLISTLLLAGDERGNYTQKYNSARDVLEDLQHMANNFASCSRNVVLDDLTIQGRLQVPNNEFYGRQVQKSMLLNLFHSTRAFGTCPLMATVSGCPGTGKSSLVNQIKEPLQHKNGYFMEGKFDSSTRPDIVLAFALNNFFGTIISNYDENMQLHLRCRIQGSIGPGGNVLTEAMPNLCKLLRIDIPREPVAAVGVMGSSYRLKFMFCKLINSIASWDHPLVLFLDDLQWADEMTLDVIRMIMTDPDIQHFLFIGCYRDDEVNNSHPLLEKLRSMQNQGVSIMNIKMGPIEKESVNALISDTLCLPPNLCKPLSEIVYSKTGGIILFVLKFLNSLNDEESRLIWFSLANRRWEFDLEKIRLKEISADVVQYMTQHMTRLSSQIQMGLKLSSCLGPSFDGALLEKVKNESHFGVDHFLNFCQERGYLQQSISGKYVWAHDQVQQAAYELIPSYKRESFHLLLGSRLFIQATEAEMEHLIFLVVDNINRGLRLVQNPIHKNEVSLLNLHAGEKAISCSAFHSAAEYLTAGISLLENNSWGNNYSLAIRLYNGASEALFITGNFSLMISLIEEPLLHARCFEDKLIIYNNLVRSLVAAGKLEDASFKCFDVLSQLGEDISVDVTEDVYRDEVARVKRLLRGKSRKELLSLPVMTNRYKLAAMQFLNHALSLTYIAKPFLTPIIIFRILKMSIEYGICNISAFGFGCYGAWLAGVHNSDFDGGYRMGRVATGMMERLGATNIIPRLYTVVYSFINIFKEPFQASRSRFLEGYEAGVLSGDMEYGIYNLYHHVSLAAYGCGTCLIDLSTEIQVYIKRAIQCNQGMALKFLVILYQLVLDLMGANKNAYSYFGEVTEEQFFSRSRQNNEISVCRSIFSSRKYVAFWTGDMDKAAQLYEQSQQDPFFSNGRLINEVVSTFIDGLLAFYFARKYPEDEAKWANIGESVITTLKEWAKSSSWNFINKLQLLQAEYYFLKEDDARAVASYCLSIKAAHAHRFFHEEGLAYEKAATYFLHKGRNHSALEYFKNAKKCYTLWGAGALLERVDKAIDELAPS